MDRHSVAPAPLTSGPRGELGVAKFSHSRVSDAHPMQQPFQTRHYQRPCLAMVLAD